MINEKISSYAASEALPSMASLQAFSAAARSLSFAAAARKLGRTPSAISHAVRDLEFRLGVPLFERVGRAVRLTKAGADYVEAVDAALTKLGEAAQSLRTRTEDHIVRISALPFFTSAVLLPNLNRFEARNPGYELRIETSNAYADVANGEVDIAIRFGRRQREGLYRKPLIKVTGQPIASPDYLANAPKLDCAEDLTAHALIHVRPNGDAWPDWAAAQGLEALQGKTSLVFDSILGALDAVKAGRGIALSMAPLIETYPGYGHAFVPVLSPGARRGLSYDFVCRRISRDDRKIQRVLAWLEESLAAGV